MFLSVRHKPMREKALNSVLVNSDTGEKIPHVVWANDTTGRYRQFLTDKAGSLMTDDKKTKILSKIFTGRIKIVKKADFESTL